MGFIPVLFGSCPLCNMGFIPVLFDICGIAIDNCCVGMDNDGCIICCCIICCCNNCCCCICFWTNCWSTIGFCIKYLNIVGLFICALFKICCCICIISIWDI